MDCPGNVIGWSTRCFRSDPGWISGRGKSAIDVAHQARPSLILLDIMMPGMDGYEVCRRLKAEPATQSSAVIFCSALDDTRDIVKGLEVGAVDYISKPFQAEEVLARVDTHLTIRRLQDQLRERNEALKHELQVAQELVEDATARVEGPLLGDSEAVTLLRAQIERLVHGDDPVLLFGPSGSGHEAIGRAIHNQSQRRNRPFIYVNCLNLGA